MVAVLGAAPAFASEPVARPRVAVINFDTALSGHTLPPPDMGISAAQAMIDRLVASGDYQVFDGHWLVTSPRNDRNSRGIQLDAVREKAAAAGVDYLVVGTITRFSEERRNRGLGGATFRVPVIGGVSRQRADLFVWVLVKLVDVRTGEIVTTATGVGNSSRTKLNLGGLAPIGGAIFSRSSTNPRDAQLDEAMQRSVDLASRGLVAWRHR